MTAKLIGRALAGAGAFGIGAALMYFLDPDRGRRRRALARDKASSLANKADDAVTATARDLGNRARGLAAETRALWSDGPIADDVLLARVRSKLGSLVSQPRSIEVEAHDGQIVLKGPILACEVDTLLAQVATIGGVRAVESQLEAHESAEGVPGLQDGERP